jgi:hypothetical protein
VVWLRRLILLIAVLFGLIAAIEPDDGLDRSRSLKIALVLLFIYVLAGFQIQLNRRAMRRRE